MFSLTLFHSDRSGRSWDTPLSVKSKIDIYSPRKLALLILPTSSPTLAKVREAEFSLVPRYFSLRFPFYWLLARDKEYLRLLYLLSHHTICRLRPNRFAFYPRFLCFPLSIDLNDVLLFKNFSFFLTIRARSYLVAMQLAICNSLGIVWEMKRARLHHFCALLISHAISNELQIASCIATKYERTLSVYFFFTFFKSLNTFMKMKY